jgi:hypothetical protein
VNGSGQRQASRGQSLSQFTSGRTITDRHHSVDGSSVAKPDEIVRTEHVSTAEQFPSSRAVHVVDEASDSSPAQAHDLSRYASMPPGAPYDDSIANAKIEARPRLGIAQINAHCSRGQP